MKALILICIILTGIFSGFKSGQKTLLNDNSEIKKFYCPNVSEVYNPDFKNSKKENYSEDWYGKVSENIINDEYNISFSDEQNSYQSPNRESNLRFVYSKNGFNVKPRDKGQSDDWEIEFELFNVRRETSNNTTPPSPLWKRGEQRGVHFANDEFVINGNTAYIENADMRINYTNDINGMRQDFIVKNKPNGEGKLRLNLSAKTNLKMIAGADALMFKNSIGNDVMKYSALKVWDSNGKALRAYFENNYELRIANYELGNKSEIKDQKSKIETNSKSEIPRLYGQANPKFFSIVVNDEDAVYPVTIDPLSSTPDWSAEANSDKAAMGSSVSSAGDVNGDGYGDIIIGAPEYDNGIYKQGKAYVYLGSSTGLSSSPHWTFLGNQNQCYFGTSVSTAGDLNGDGFSDIIVGAPDYTNGQTREGKVFAYYGSSAGLSVSPDWTAESNSNNANFGNSVSTCGDVNGDGYSDVIIGAPGFGNGQNSEGKAYVYFGSASGLHSSPDWTTESNQDNAKFGNCVSSAGDVNADGYSDVIVASYLFDNDQSDEGKVFAYYGSSAGLSAVSDWSMESDQSGAEFGISISTAGDVNGDGYSDVIIGAQKFDATHNNAGKVFVYYGSASGLNSLNWSFWETQAGSNLGYSVSLAGDVNGDGYSDILVSAISYNNGASDEGKVYLFYGNSSALGSTPDWSAEGNQVTANFGSSVFTAGDVNGDGISDIIIGARYFDNGQNNEGKVFVYNGSASGLPQVTNWMAAGTQASSQFGISVASAGDVNGDGYSDVIVGATNYDNNDFDQGRAYAYYGSASGLSLTPDWTVTGSSNVYTHFGRVSTAGDVNGDGYSDVIVGAHNDYSAQGRDGKVHVYHGSATGLSLTPNWTAKSGQDGSYFGYSVSTAGDVNGDGYSDVIVGAMMYDQEETDEGKIYIYYGSGSGLPSSPSHSRTSGIANKFFGRSVSTAGDVNGDGYSDVIVGGCKYVFNGTDNNGSVYVIHGSSNGLINGQNFYAGAVNSGATMGFSVASAGDVNGDGYSDIVFGIPYWTSGQTEEGKIFVYYGSSSGLNYNNAWTTESNLAHSYFGQSVSGAGDVNGDGYSDIIAGAWGYSNGQASEGAAFVYYGSPSGMTTANTWTGESNQSSALYGSCVSSAGDVNGDGYSDVVVSSTFYSSHGALFLYYGNGKTGIKSNVQQYKPNSNNIISSGGYTGTLGSVKLSLYGKSTLGRSDGKLVYECKENGQLFSSGATISNSVFSMGSGSMTDISAAGLNLSKDISGFNPDKEYKWRARVQYSPVNNPYQKFGPWKYYTNYITKPAGGFKTLSILPRTFHLGVNIEGLYNENTNLSVKDTVRVYLRHTIAPYAVLDSAKTFLDSNGHSIFHFYKNLSGNSFYIQIKHRNSVETWSSTYVSYLNNQAAYNFYTDVTKAYGNNLKQKGSRFCIYSGDVNQNGNIDASDLSRVDNDAFNFVTGYVPTDVTGNNVTDADDLAITDNNAFDFVSKITPP